MRMAAVWLSAIAAAIGVFGYFEPSSRAAYFAGFLVAAALLFGSAVVADALTQHGRSDGEV